MSNKKDLQKAEAKLLQLEKRKTAIEREMRGWIQVIKGLRLIAAGNNYRARNGDTSHSQKTKPLSFADKVRSVLQDIDAPVGAVQIRDHIFATGTPEESSTKNLLINIHTTLRRLVASGEVREVPLPDGSKLYQYVSSMERALNDLPVGQVSLTSLYGNAIEKTLGRFTTPRGRTGRDYNFKNRRAE